ncbi:hypothetical protein D2T29_20420 [Sinirhodobacter populi]|uniref:Uncharacterized protein n=1 Tax=Paenirhodobacter populi TaxID=2306993 RepID=A0A443K151_9RHOB|nr:hypothetical protein D2T29_20420 [Sinirhodobacter populi]
MKIMPSEVISAVRGRGHRHASGFGKDDREQDTPQHRARKSVSVVEDIILTPVEGKVEIDVRGDLAGILTLSVQKKNPTAGAAGSQVNLVAGAGSQKFLPLHQGGFVALSGRLPDSCL